MPGHAHCYRQELGGEPYLFLQGLMAVTCRSPTIAVALVEQGSERHSLVLPQGQFFQFLPLLLNLLTEPALLVISQGGTQAPSRPITTGRLWGPAVRGLEPLASFLRALGQVPLQILLFGWALRSGAGQSANALWGAGR